jgi:hypothetical protein
VGAWRDYACMHARLTPESTMSLRWLPQVWLGMYTTGDGRCRLFVFRGKTWCAVNQGPLSCHIRIASLGGGGRQRKPGDAVRVPEELKADAQGPRARERLHRRDAPLLHRLVARPEHEVLGALLPVRCARGGCDDQGEGG